MIQYINKNGDKLKLIDNKLVVETLDHGEYTTKKEPAIVSLALLDIIEKANKWDDLMNLIGGIKY